jgi:glycosyltransferase involved in cell wall biosynthesis
MPEIAGNAAALVDPYDTNDIADKIEQLMSDSSLRERLIAEGYERVKKFTWEACAQQILLNIKSVVLKSN